MASVAGVVGRRWWLLLLPLLLMGAAATGLLARRSTSYEAVATVRTGGNDVLAGTVRAELAGAGDLLTDATLLLDSPSFLDEVSERAGAPVRSGAFEVRSIGDGLVEIAYVAHDAEDAGRVAGAAVSLLLESRQERVAAAGREALRLFAERVTAAEAAVAKAEEALVAFDRRYPEPAPLEAPPSRAVRAQGEELAGALADRRQALDAARDRFDEAELAAEVALAEVRSEQLVDRPLRADGGRWPLWLVSLVVVAVGGAFGVLLALLAERRDHTVRDELDVQEAAPGVPILAVVDAQ